VPGSRPWPIGTPVIAVSSLGGFAEQIVVPNDAAFALPESFRTRMGDVSDCCSHRLFTRWSTEPNCAPKTRFWCWSDRRCRLRRSAASQGAGAKVVAVAPTTRNSLRSRQRG